MPIAILASYFIHRQSMPPPVITPATLARELGKALDTVQTRGL